MPLNLGFVGTGMIASIHLDNLSKMKDVKIVAVCDVVREKAIKIAQQFNATPYFDHYNMFEKERLDGCYVCVPPFAHSDIEVLAAKKRINLFIEKPVGLDLKKAKKIEKAIQKSGIIVSAGYVLRYLDTVRKAKQLLHGKKIALVYGRYFGGIVAVPWWTIKKKSGGQIVEQTSHIVDLARYLAGEMDSVYVQGFCGLNKKSNKYNIEDASVMNLHFRNGAIGSIISTCLLSGWLPELEIVTKDMQIQIQINPATVLKVTAKGKRREIKSKCNGYLLEDRIFIDAIKSGDDSKIRCNYSDALKTLSVTLVANESIQAGKIVYL